MLRSAFLLVAVWLVASGCDSGPRLVEFEGTIKVASKPMDQIYVEFWPENNGPRSIGTTDAQGKFTLTSDDGKKGALAGKHRVVLRDLSIINRDIRGRDAENIDITMGRKPRILEAYGDIGQTTLRAEVTADKKALELDVEPYSGT